MGTTKPRARTVTWTTGQSCSTETHSCRRPHKSRAHGSTLLLFSLILLLHGSQIGLSSWKLVARSLIAGLTRLGERRVVLLRNGQRIRRRLRGATAEDRQRHEARVSTIGPHHGHLLPNLGRRIEPLGDSLRIDPDQRGCHTGCACAIVTRPDRMRWCLLFGRHLHQAGVIIEHMPWPRISWIILPVLLLAESACGAPYDPPVLGDHTSEQYKADLEKCRTASRESVRLKNAATPEKWIISPFTGPPAVRAAIRTCMAGKGYTLEKTED